MSDPFESYVTGLESPASHLITVTPDDAADLTVPSRALNVGIAGVVRVTTVGGTTADISVAAGITFPVRVTRIWATGTTATNIIAMY